MQERIHAPLAQHLAFHIDAGQRFCILLSHDPDVVAAYAADPLVHDRITPRMYTEMMAAARAAAAERFPDLPVLVLVPGADRVVQPEATLRLTSGLAGDVTVRHYPDARHEAFNDIGRDAVLADIRGWIASRC